MDATNKPEIILEAIPASPGIAHGRAFVVQRSELQIPVYTVEAAQRAAEVARLEQSLVATRQQVTKMQQEVERTLGPDEARIFDAHFMVLQDPALIAETIRELEKTSRNIESCFRDVGMRYVNAFEQIPDGYMRERSADIRDVVERVLHNLTGRSRNALAHIADDRILITHDISPSESAALDQSKVLGLVTDAGSRTSHAVIMARSMKLPAIVGAQEATKQIEHNDWVIVDGYDGIVVINPSEQTLFRYGKLQLKRKTLEKKILASARQPAETLDKRKIKLLANIDSADDVERARESGAEGVGLFRTEYLYLQNEIQPTEEMQYVVYRRVAEFFGSQPVVIRTLDLGGDKPLRWASITDEPESNPFLGFRAIRFCLEHPALFKDQLRAILRASAHGNVRLMFPMISGGDELTRAQAVLEESKEELRTRGVPFNEELEVGSMIEIPSAALTSDILAKTCDFFSIGTNDLIQYLLAVDRVNPRTAHLYEPTHPAVLRLIQQVCKNAHAAKVKVAVCGEMAGDPVCVPLLLGLGVDELSAAPASLPGIKYLVQHMRSADAARLSREALRMNDPKEIAARAQAFYKDCVGDMG
jgi:phosphoenolpyruvate-protein phosphotransferase (PTS system enzyme I)